MPSSPKLITSAEACDQLRIDRSTLSRWVSAGKIKPAMQGPGPSGAFWFTEQSVNALRERTAS